MPFDPGSSAKPSRPTTAGRSQAVAWALTLTALAMTSGGCATMTSYTYPAPGAPECAIFAAVLAAREEPSPREVYALTQAYLPTSFWWSPPRHPSPTVDLRKCRAFADGPGLNRTWEPRRTFGLEEGDAFTRPDIESGKARVEFGDSMHGAQYTLTLQPDGSWAVTDKAEWWIAID